MVDTVDHYVVSAGWAGEGRRCRRLGPDVLVRGVWWTPVLFDDEEDPTFFKYRGLTLVSCEPKESNERR